ncbi:MAG: histidine ammonia-lyase [Paraglaciecola sp.]|jgi:histidine ammonia-lyase
MGACLQQMHFAAQTLVVEANGVSDNPLVLADSGDILSEGKFHA